MSDEPNNDYLWDRSGPPDPEIQRLENVLGRLRHAKPAPEFDAVPVQQPQAAEPRPRSRLARHWPRLAAAGALAVLALATGVWLLNLQLSRSWEVARLDGAPIVGERVISRKGRLPLGGAVETDSRSRARISVGLIGEVEVEPNSRVRLLTSRPTDHRLALDHGTLNARIWAPPRLFFVETRAGLAVDLGCKYTLTMEPGGSGMLNVIEGWVAFEKAGRESFVPAGAVCAVRQEVGPGTPHFADAPEALVTALRQLDFEPLSAEARAAALDQVLKNARRRDAIVLWHLLPRVRYEEADRVFDRLAELVPPPKDISRQAALLGDRYTMDLWWDQLGLGRSFWWRFHKGPVPGK